MASSLIESLSWVTSLRHLFCGEKCWSDKNKEYVKLCKTLYNHEKAKNAAFFF